MSTDHGFHWSKPQEISGSAPGLCSFGNAFSPPLSFSDCNFDQGSDPVVMPNGDLVVVRDPWGIRPLCIAEEGPLFAAASESVPLSNLGFKGVHSLEPGTLAIVNAKGVRIAMGTDSGITSHGDTLHEQTRMANQGMPAEQCLASATANAADLLGIASTVGTLEPGKLADLIVVADVHHAHALG